MSKEQLIELLRGQIERLEHFNATEESVYGALLIILSSAGYLSKKEEHYIRRI